MRLVPANLDIVFEEVGDRESEFLAEFNRLNVNEEDPLGAWFKRAKARGDTKESDQVLLTLVMELHRKFDELNALVRNETTTKLELKNGCALESIGFDGLGIREDLLSVGEIYYARISMPVFPKRDIGLFFEAVTQKTGKIIKMHENDESDFNGYVTSRERIMIRELRGKDE